MPRATAKQRDFQLEVARAEIAQLTEAIKAQAIELAVAVAERWEAIDRSHRKLAHRGSSTPRMVHRCPQDPADGLQRSLNVGSAPTKRESSGDRGPGSVLPTPRPRGPVVRRIRT